MISQCVHLHGLAGLQADTIAVEVSDEGDFCPIRDMFTDHRGGRVVTLATLRYKGRLGEAL